ncbi:MAG: BNR/Asp-box repeat protein [Flavipsychrobacter sp.]|nr:BNR/Asp-box repeat protein [Flavipsychrobacter sp.]
MRTALRTFVLFAMLTVSGTYNTVNAQTPTVDDGKIRITSIAHIGDLIFAGTRNNGVYKSSDGGKTWTPANNGLPAYVPDLAANGNTLFAIAFSKYQTLFASSDNGASWKELNVCPGEVRIYSATVFKNKVFAATQKGLYQSTNNGASWNLVEGVEAGDITSVVAGSSQMLAKSYKSGYGICYSSDNGEDWRIVKGESVSSESIEAHGNMIIGSRCASSDNLENMNTCRLSQAWILSKSGKKWEKVDMEPRYFGFDDADNIYAINVTIEEKKKEFIYHREVLKSVDRGNSWKAVDENNDPFMSADQGMQEKLGELEVWRVIELQQKIWQRDAIAKSKVDEAARRAALQKKIAEENAKYTGGGYQSKGSQTTFNTPDYRALSNDRFKAMNNHRDSWIDSRGGMHIH